MSKKTTHYLKYKALQTIWYASEQANRIGCELNTHLTINGKLLGLTPYTMESFTTKLLKALKRHAKDVLKLNSEFVYLVIMENHQNNLIYESLDETDHNIHAHIFAHASQKNKKAFIKALYSRIEKVIQKKLPEGAIDIKNHDNARYGLKGGEEAELKKLGVWEKVKDKASPQGAVYGRRSWCSPKLGPTIRRKLDNEKKINRKLNRFHAEKNR